MGIPSFLVSSSALRSLFWFAWLSSAQAAPVLETGPTPQLNSPSPARIQFSKVVGWPEGITPRAPEGFWVGEYARNLVSPRNLYEGPNGDVFVAEANTELQGKGFKKEVLDLIGYTRSQYTETCACRITLLRDTDHDGHPDVQEVMISGLNQPYGMVIHQGFFYIAETDGVWRYPYTPGQTRLSKAERQPVLELPAGGYNNHWTRNLIKHPAQNKLYVSVGSGSNIAENGLSNEIRRANILEIDLDTQNSRVFASGLRNPVGMSWSKQGSNQRQLWTVVNERDGLGDTLVPDYLTGLRDGDFFGWPYSYFGQNIDPRVKPQRPEQLQQTRVPDFALGAHTASLGLDFYHQQGFPDRYHQGAFIGQHGSWNRSHLVGYQVAFVPFRNGKPSGPLEPFLTGFIADRAQATAYGRPVGVTVLRNGNLLVADDAGHRIWQVRPLPGF